MPHEVWKIGKLRNVWTHRARSSASGENAFSKSGWLDLKNAPAGAVPRFFPPRVVVAVKALACELPARHKIPISRLSVSEIRREVVRQGIVASIGDTTIWRWLSEDAIRPWLHRSWIFPRDPDFEEKAARVLDLYEGLWKGRRLKDRDFVISADEKTSIQAFLVRNEVSVLEFEEGRNLPTSWLST